MSTDDERMGGANARTKAATGVVYSPIYKEHAPGLWHPEKPERCDAVLHGIRTSAPESAILSLAPRPATEEELYAVHTAEYVATARRDIAAGLGTLSTGDTDVCPRTWGAALMAAGGVLCALDAVMAGTVRNAFCAVRPPGHHATADRGMGFCVFNNIAMAARHAQRKHGVGRVLIADWDVHHGNGTQEIFYEDPTVFYFSTHQWPFYPGTGAARETGAGAGKGFTLNCPFPAGAGGVEVRRAFTEQLAPAMEKFRPELVLVSAGFDGVAGDLIGNFRLTDEDFVALTEIVMDLARRYAGGRLVSVLEGGYTLRALASAAGAHVRKLCDA